jgi:hypothetical protein
VGRFEFPLVTQSGSRAGFVVLGNYVGDEDIQRLPQTSRLTSEAFSAASISRISGVTLIAWYGDDLEDFAVARGKTMAEF